MPKVLSYTPPWLSRPSPGYNLFSSESGKESSGTPNGLKVASNGKRNDEYRGPRRSTACRDTEIFTVVDNQIRWSDLSMLRYDWESSHRQRVARTDENEGLRRIYRILDVHFGETIRQLSVSPNGEFLAIATSHTVHVAFLPSSSAFDEGKDLAIKVILHTVGPTTHVLKESPIASILWHPCGVNGSCLVTVTAEAVVRLWEVNKLSRGSFNIPTLAIDMRKLESATSQEDNIAPRPMGGNRGFSADMIDLEIASACFGGTGSPHESPWSAMTLWAVTTEGDVYALCPLLPSRWQPTSTQIPALSTIADAQRGSSSPDQPMAGEDLSMQEDQWTWLTDIDAQLPFLAPRENDITVQDTIYSRPDRPGPVPRLQGPFGLSDNSSYSFLDVSDINVIASKIDVEELMQGEDDDSEYGLQENSDGLSADIICILTTDGRVHLFLNLDGVEGQWLPTKPPRTLTPGSESRELVLLEVLETLRPGTIAEDEWPTFSKDPISRYSFFITHSQGIYFFSLAPWLDQLDKELLNSSTSGSLSRLRTMRGSTRTLRERIIRFDHSMNTEASTSANACITLYDSDLGYFLLTSNNENTYPHAASLDVPKTALVKTEPLPDEADDSFAYLEDEEPLTELVTRPAYEPSPVFWNDSSLPSIVTRTVPPHRRRTLQEEIRFSGATLELMFSTHRLLSEETASLQQAVADLINRCQRMMQEMAEQLQQVRLQAAKADQLQRGGGGDDIKGENADEKLESRLQKARMRHADLKTRMGKMSMRLTELEERPLNEKETQWLKELEQLERAIDQSVDGPINGHREGSIEPWWQRYEDVKHLSGELVETAKRVEEQGEEQKRVEDEHAVPNEIRKRKVEQVKGLLERESALVDAVSSRLERLNFGISA
ncbi:MAG: hypothetical protein Q9211_004656 [Gyalolechia sp. 1 TL-2023]